MTGSPLGADVNLQPSSYTSLAFRGVPFEEVVDHYLCWYLGEGAFQKQRRRREALGIEPVLGRDVVGAGGDFRCEGRSLLRVRRAGTGDEWLMHWSHVDDKRDDVTWHNVARVRRGAASTDVEQLTALIVPADGSVTRNAGAPAVTTELVRRYGHAISPVELFRGSAFDLETGGAPEFIDRALFSPVRRAPIVLVAPTNHQGPFLVDVELLAKRLVGMAVVFKVASSAVCWELTDALMARGLDERFGAYDGAVRMFWPGEATPGEDYNEHPLWLRHTLQRPRDDLRTERLATRIVGVVAERSNARALLSVIGQMDLLAWQDNARSLLSAPAHHPQVQHRATTVQALEQARRENAALRAALEEARSLQVYFAAEHKQLAFEHEVEKAEHRAVAKELEAANAVVDIGSVVAAVKCADRVLSPQLKILKSAMTSAAHSTFRDPRLVFDVLILLASSRGSKGFDVGKELALRFGGKARWRPKDSEATTKAFGSERRFALTDGTTKTFSSHITFGGSAAKDKCLQLYYDTLDDGTVRVAYVGVHLRTVGHDT